MNRKKIGLTAFLTATACVASLASCGTDVPQSENSGLTGEFSISEGIVDENQENQPVETDAENGEPTSEESTDENGETETTTSAEGEETGENSETTTVASYSIQTRDPSLITTTKKPATNPPPASTTKAVVLPPTNNTTAGTTAQGGTITTPSQNAGTSNGITLSYYSKEVAVGETADYPLVSENVVELWTSSDPSVATVDGDGNITGVGAGKCTIKVQNVYDNSQYATVTVTVKAPASTAATQQTTPPTTTTAVQGMQVINNVTYINGILIANKSYSLPSTYDPQGLTNDTYNAFEQLASDAAAEGLNIWLASGYRSYNYQNEIYNNYVSWYGQDSADTFSARPGHSEHQTGLAIDVNSIDDTFIGTPEAIWLEEHCTDYGFIIRYPKGKQEITGYKYEPWHIRYVGKEFAAEFRNAMNMYGDSTLTLEEYFGIDSKYSE